jgi:hypothetical protein
MLQGKGTQCRVDEFNAGWVNFRCSPPDEMTKQSYDPSHCRWLMFCELPPRTRYLKPNARIAMRCFSVLHILDVRRSFFIRMNCSNCSFKYVI